MAGSETKLGTEHEFGRESALHDRIKNLFFEQGLEDKEIHRALEDEGFGRHYSCDAAN